MSTATATTPCTTPTASSTTPAATDQLSEEENQVDFVKHPLQNEWQLWYWKGEKKEWILNLLEVTTFKTVEDFWALYNHIELASDLKIGSDYSVFKLGIKPMWEDSRNTKGGRWLFTFQKSLNKLIDEMWLEALLCLIGDAFGEESDQICGAVINIRRGVDKIAVWTSDYKDEAAVMKIGRILKQRMNYNSKITYEAHEDTQNKHGQKWLYMVE